MIIVTYCNITVSKCWTTCYIFFFSFWPRYIVINFLHFIEKNFRQGINCSTTMSRCQCEIITSRSTMNLLREAIFQTGRDSSMAEKWKRKRLKKNVKPFQRFIFALRLTLGKRNKFGSSILSLFLPSNKIAFTQISFFRFNCHETFHHNVVWYCRTALL